MPQNVTPRNMKHARRALKTLNNHTQHVVRRDYLSPLDLERLLTDLQHFCRWKGIDFDEMVEFSKTTFAEEII